MRLYLALLLTLIVGAIADTAAADAGKDKAAACAACHGVDGNSPIAPEYPKLGGQHATYIRAQLAAFKAGKRKNNMMAPMAANVSAEDAALIADYFSTQKPQYGESPKETLAEGQKLYRGGDAATGVPACMACHGPRGSGNPAAGYPALHGQNSAYTLNQLKAYRSGERNSDNNAIMRTIAGRMTDTEINAVAGYLQGLH
jgi:cytochrome c553